MSAAGDGSTEGFKRVEAFRCSTVLSLSYRLTAKSRFGKKKNPREGHAPLSNAALLSRERFSHCFYNSNASNYYGVTILSTRAHQLAVPCRELFERLKRGKLTTIKSQLPLRWELRRYDAVRLRAKCLQ